MDWPLIASLDEVLLEVQSGPPRRVLFWGEGAGGISSYVAGWMAGRGIDVILLDGANRFDPYMVSSFAKRALIPPERLLRRIRIARAFTCYQMATLMGERLAYLLKQEETAVRVKKLWVILLGPITTFFDEDVPEKEVRPLFERALERVEGMATEGVPFFLFQPNSPGLPLVPACPALGRDRGRQALNRAGTGQAGRGGERGLSKRAYLAKRLFQFSDLVWRISLENEGAKIILEKGLTEIADRRLQIAD